jgi:1,4-alpha-glucan branching enzyme
MSRPEHLGIAALSEKDMHCLRQGCHPDPFAVLGPHFVDGVGFVRAYMPEALGITITSRKSERPVEMANVGEGIFEAIWDYNVPYRFDINWSKDIQQTVDPYAFGAQLTDDDLYLFSEGGILTLQLGLAPTFARPTAFEGSSSQFGRRMP